MANIFHIDEKMSRMVDPQKSNLWLVDIGHPKCIKDHTLWCSDSGYSIDFKTTLQFRATSVSLPDRRVDVASSKYLGHTYNFPLPSDSGTKTIDIEFLEREDQRVVVMLNSWLHEIYDHSMLEDSFYRQYPDFKNSFTTDIKIRQYALNGKILPAEVKIGNAFITGLSGTKLDYGSSSAVTYSATFTFDYWSLDGTENSKDALLGD